MDVISTLKSDFKDTKRDDKTVLRKYLIFQGKVKAGIRKNDQGHYEMPLLLQPHLPDIKKLAEIRLSHLQQKLYRDEKYKDNTTHERSH